MQQRMRIVLIALIVGLVGIPIFADTTINFPEQKVSIQEWDQTVYVGEEFTAGNLAANFSTGYQWLWLIEEKQPIEFVHAQVIDLNYPKRPAPGMPPPSTDYFFKATQPGEFILRFIYKRPGAADAVAEFKIIHLKVVAKSEIKNKKKYEVTFPAKTITEVEPPKIGVSVGDTISIPAAKGHCSYLTSPEKQEEKNVELISKKAGVWQFKAIKPTPRMDECIMFINIKYDAKGIPVDILGYKTQCVKIKG